MMKKETIKEAGKLLLDFTKVVLAVAIIAPYVKDGHIEITPFVFAGISTIFGLYLINKGAKDE